MTAPSGLVVVDKPAGLVVHPGAGHADGTLVDALAGIEHAGAAHEHVRAGTGGLDQPPWLASAHAAASPPASTS